MDKIVAKLDIILFISKGKCKNNNDYLNDSLPFTIRGKKAFVIKIKIKIKW